VEAKHIVFALQQFGYSNDGQHCFAHMGRASIESLPRIILSLGGFVGLSFGA
jgi:hypothetical protein